MFSGSIALKADSSTQGVLLGIILEILLLVFSKGHLHEAGDRCRPSGYKANAAGFLVGAVCPLHHGASLGSSLGHILCAELQVRSPRPSWPYCWYVLCTVLGALPTLLHPHNNPTRSVLLLRNVLQMSQLKLSG